MPGCASRADWPGETPPCYCPLTIGLLLMNLPCISANRSTNTLIGAEPKILCMNPSSQACECVYFTFQTFRLTPNNNLNKGHQQCNITL